MVARLCRGRSRVESMHKPWKVSEESGGNRPNMIEIGGIAVGASLQSFSSHYRAPGPVTHHDGEIFEVGGCTDTMIFPPDMSDMEPYNGESSN